MSDQNGENGKAEGASSGGGGGGIVSTLEGAKSVEEMSTELTTCIESKLGGSPLVLSVLGHLVLIAAEGKDFSLLPARDAPAEERAKLEGKIEHLKDPSSFRACLRQVCYANCDTLRKAHNNMIAVRVRLSTVPGDLRDALELMEEGSAEDIADLLPGDLDRLRKCAADGNAKVNEVVEAIDLVIKLLEEMALCCQGSKSRTEVAIDEGEDDLKDAKENAEELEEELDELRTELAKVSRSYEKAEELFLTELHSKGSLATAVSAAALSAVDALSNAARTITDPLGRLKDFAAVTARDAADSARDVLGMQPRESSESKASVLNAATKILNKVFPVLSKAFKGGALDWVALKDPRFLKRAETKLSAVNVADEDVEDLKADLQELVSSIRKAREGGPEQEEKGMWEDFKKLKGDCTDKVKEIKESIAAEEKEAKDSIISNGGGAGGGGIAENYLKSQAEKLSAVQTYKDAIEAKLDDKQKAERQRRKELRETVQKLRRFESNVATQKQVLQTIQKALAQLDELKKMWSKVGSFFSDLQAVMDGMTAKQIDKFVSVSEKVQGKKQDSAEWKLSKFHRKRLVSAGEMASRSTVALQMLTETFCSISERHLKPMTEEFSSYLALSDKGEIAAAKAELDRKAEKANAEIAGIAETAAGDFAGRMEKLSLTFQKEE